jgi:hypothetical protein
MSRARRGRSPATWEQTGNHGLHVAAEEVADTAALAHQERRPCASFSSGPSTANRTDTPPAPRHLTPAAVEHDQVQQQSVSPAALCTAAIRAQDANRLKTLLSRYVTALEGSVTPAMRAETLASGGGSRRPSKRVSCSRASSAAGAPRTGDRALAFGRTRARDYGCVGSPGSRYSKIRSAAGGSTFAWCGRRGPGVDAGSRAAMFAPRSVVEAAERLGRKRRRVTRSALLPPRRGAGYSTALRGGCAQQPLSIRFQYSVSPVS